ncbi:MAG: AMP-binding protein [Candidatus Sericytochromatia bacterium]|nr:AMP-binding protein [Candidatus Sericytochromatia bacterium]
MPDLSAITSFTGIPSVTDNLYHRTMIASGVNPDKIAIWERPMGAPDDLAVSFSNLRASANRLAHWLRRRGVGTGDRVLVWVPMSTPLYAVMLGVAQIGAVCVFIDPAAGHPAVERACAHAAPAAVVGVHAARWFALLSPAVRAIPHRLWLSTRAPLLPREAADSAVAEVLPETAVACVYTTGSTGEPKAVQRSHGYVWAQLAALNLHPSKHPDAVDMPSWPMLLFDGLCHGRTSVIPAFPAGKLARAKPALLLAQMARHGVTLWVGPPALAEGLCAAAEAASRPLPFRHAFVGGALVTPALLKRMQGLMPEGEAFGVYGSTEADPVTIVSAREIPEGPPNAGVCIGHLHPDLDLRLVTPLNREALWAELVEVPAGQVGEMMVSGAHVNTDPSQVQGAWRRHKVQGPDGRIWHRMGDLAGQGANGMLYLQGRLAHRVERSCGPIDGIPVTLAALALPQVQAAAVLPRGGTAWLVVQPREEADLHEAMARLEEAVAPFGPIEIVFHPDLPRDVRHHSRVDLEALREDLPDHPPVLPAKGPPPPWPKAFHAYFQERFPLAKTLLGVAVMVAADGFATLALIQEPLSWQLAPRFALVLALFTAVFFHLRVFDEHKDWLIDRVAFPERVLSRGWVSLRQLRMAAWGAIALELALAAWAGPVLLVWTLVLIAYTWLMLREFYVGDWLRRHLVLYGVSHMAIISLMSLTAYAAILDALPSAAVAALAAQAGPDGTLGGLLPPVAQKVWHPSLMLFAGMNFCLIYSLEVARKVRVPSQERPQVDTYSRRLGIPGALALVIGMQGLALGLLALAAPALHVGSLAILSGAAAIGLVTLAFVRFARRPSAEQAKKLEAVATLTLLTLNGVLLASWGMGR